MPVLPHSAKAGLAIAHPGHELRIHGWLEAVKPLVFVLTDGSGRCGQSRLDSTTRLLDRAGAKPGSIYGRLPDRLLYASVLNQNIDLFIRLTEELAEALIRDEIDYVAGDAAEGAIMGHDVWRLVIDAACEMATRARGRRIASFDFLVSGPPDPYQGTPPPEAIWLELDEEALRRKLAAALDYRELKDFTDSQIRQWGVKAFRVECLRQVDNRSGYASPAEEPPFWEWWGEQQVAAGTYERAIRYRQHVVPLAKVLWRHVERSG